MATFVLIPGAGGAGDVYWSDLAAILRRGGHTVVPVEIAGDDPALGLPEYADAVDGAIGTHRDVVLVAQSMGGFTVPMITKRDRVSRIVFLNAMIPLPYETPAEWFVATGADDARRVAALADGRDPDFDLRTVFLHDIAPEVVGGMVEHHRDPADTPFSQPCTFDSWPPVPMHVLVAGNDRFFPLGLQSRVARERLGIAAMVTPGGHLVAKSRPADIARCLLIFLMQHDIGFDFAAAATELGRIALGIRDDQFEEPTPCAGWSVRDVLAHLCGLATTFGEAARHDLVAATPGAGAPLPPNWRIQLPRDLDVLVTAWRDPAAWRGAAEANDVTMPSPEVASVGLTELVVHAWDLATATGQSFSVTPKDLAVCTDFATAISAPEMLASRRGLYADVVSVPDDAPPLEQLLALTGRAPLVPLRLRVAP